MKLSQQTLILIALVILGFSMFGEKKEALLPPGQFIFKPDCSFITNVPQGELYKQSGAWISVDAGSGMTGYGYAGYSSFSCQDPSATLLSATSMSANELCTRSGYPTRLYLREGTKGLFFDSEDPDAADAVTTCDVEPFCGDGICNGDETDETCPSDCGTTPECPSMSVLVGCRSVSRDDLGLAINSWVQS